jgi:SAM-dependent methyltransferase
MSNKSYQRWLKAQDAEKRFWNTHSDEHLTREYWSKHIRHGFAIDFDFFKDKDVLEIGAGPSGIIYSIEEAKSRAAIEPMDMDGLFKDEPIKRKIIRKGQAEDIPFDASMFDIVVCFNVLDHCYDPFEVIKECSRVLRSHGILLLWIHALRNRFSSLRQMLNRLDPPHPNHFTTDQIKRLIDNHFNLQNIKIVKGVNIYGHKPSITNLKLYIANYLTENVWFNYTKSK